MSQLFLIAFRSLVQHRRRTLLLGGAIAGVSSLLVFLMCLSAGVKASTLESALTLATGHINIGGFYKVTAGQSSPLVTQYQDVQRIAQSSLDDLDYLVLRGRGWARAVSDQGSMQVAIGGLDIAHEPGFRRVVQLLSGRLDDLAEPNTLLLFEKQAKKLNVKVGDMVVLSVLTPRGVNNTIDLRVVAIAKNVGFMSEWNIFVPQQVVRDLYQLKADATGAIHLYVKDMRRIPQDLEKVRNALTAAGYRLMDPEAKAFWMKFDSVNREDWTGQKLDLTTWEDEISFLKWMATAVEGLTYALTTVLLIIIAVGIMNSTWIAIRERTREIGTLRAIGMQRRRVLVMFLVEAFTLGAIGTVLGTTLGLGLAGVVHLMRVPVPEAVQIFLMSDTMKFAVDLPRILAGMAIITACTTLISLIPSTHAARMKPITAMQHIG